MSRTIRNSYSSKSFSSSKFSNSKKCTISWNSSARAKRAEIVELGNWSSDPIYYIANPVTVNEKFKFSARYHMLKMQYVNFVSFHENLVETEMENDYWDIKTEEGGLDSEIEYQTGISDASFILSEKKFSDLTNFIFLEYISDDTFKYYFGDISKENVPEWAILARFVYTPTDICELSGLSKKTVKKIYNQFGYNWLPAIKNNPKKLLEWFKHFDMNLPDQFKNWDWRLNQESYNLLCSLYKKNKDKFYLCERGRENGEDFLYPANIESLDNLIRVLFDKSPEGNKVSLEGESVEKIIHNLEQRLCFDGETSTEELPEKVLEFFKEISSNPKKIYRIGLEFKNCLRYRAWNWDKTGDDCGFVGITKSGSCMRIKHTTYEWIIPEHLGPCNNSLTREQVDLQEAVASCFNS